MILKELFRESAPVFTVSVENRLSEAAASMREHRVGSLVVIDSDARVLGMVTDRDIALSLALGVATPDSFVDGIMSRPVETITENESVLKLSQKFRDIDVKRVPVVSENGKLVGIVSADDIIALLAREMYDTCSVLESKLGHMI